VIQAKSMVLPQPTSYVERSEADIKEVYESSHYPHTHACLTCLSTHSIHCPLSVEWRSGDEGSKARHSTTACGWSCIQGL